MFKQNAKKGIGVLFCHTMCIGDIDIGEPVKTMIFKI